VFVVSKSWHEIGICSSLQYINRDWSSNFKNK